MNDENSRYQDPIDRISSSYREAQVLLTANRLGVFETLGEKRLSLDELTNALEADRRGVRILCDALVSLEILEKADGCYRNAPLAMEYLLPDSPSSKNALLLHSARLYERWGKLYDTVKSGIPAPKEAIDPNLIGDERAFAKAMADVGRKSAKELAGILDLSQVKTLLDLGGGPGLYAIEFAKQNPQLNAVVFDTKETLEVAKENAKDAGLSDRVSARAGDLFGDSFGEGYDFILVSNVIHIYSYENNKELVAKCAKALAPGGRLCVKDFILEPNRAAPAWNALFAVNMLVNTEGGDCYTLAEIKEWFQNAGLMSGEVKPLARQSRVILAEKP